MTGMKPLLERPHMILNGRFFLEYDPVNCPGPRPEISRHTFNAYTQYNSRDRLASTGEEIPIPPSEAYLALVKDARQNLQQQGNKIPGLPANLAGDSVLAAAASVSVLLNERITYEMEGEKDDVWKKPNDTVATMSGDCDDYALLKREVLLSMGVPNERMFLITGRLGNLGAHALLGVMGDDGKMYILDNNTKDRTSFMEANAYMQKFDFDFHSIYQNGKQYGFVTRINPDGTVNPNQAEETNIRISTSYLKPNSKETNLMADAGQAGDQAAFQKFLDQLMQPVASPEAAVEKMAQITSPQIVPGMKI